MKEEKNKEGIGKDEFLELKVAESLQEDIDKGIARISSPIMSRTGLTSGDIIEVKGKHTWVLKVMRSLRAEDEKEIIRLDGTTRSNIGASIGDKVKIRKVEIVVAKKIVLSPLQEGIRFSDDPTEYFHSKLLHKPLVVGQKIVIDVFGTRLGYVVSKVDPKVAVIVTPETRIVISDEVQS